MTGRPGLTHPAVQTAAIALVSLAAALALTRVFADGRFVLPVIVAALVPHAVGLAGRLRRWSSGVTAALAAAATVVALTWSLAGYTTAYGLPTTATLGRIGHLVDGGWRIFRLGIAPVPATAGVVLLAAVAVAIAAMTADALARRPDVTLGALAPTLVLFVLVATLGSGRLRVATTVAYVAASLTALVALNAARTERRRTWFTGGRLSSDAALIRSAAVVGGIALCAAAIVTPLVPGIDGGPLLRYRNRTDGSGAGFGDYNTLSPLVSLRSRLRERSDAELFRVRATSANYWRLMALDRFDGTTWSLAGDAEDATDVLPGVGRRTQGVVRQQYTIGSLADRWVPAAFEPVATTVGNARVVPDSLTVVAPTQIAGLQYEVRSRIRRSPTAEQIASTAAPLPEARRRLLELPSGFSPRHRDLARGIVTAAETPWDRATALEQYFAAGDFVYDLEPELGDGIDAIDAFLATRRGFCQQFAATYAAFARAVGLPARVVVGFTPGDYDAARDEYVVRGRDAHAWVEVWFAGLGWRAFEPTPAGPLPGQAVPTGTGAEVGETATGETRTPTTTRAPATSPGSQSPSGPGAPIGSRESQISTAAAGDDGGIGGRTVLLLALGTVLALVAAGWGLRRVRAPRLRRRRRRTDPVLARRVVGAWNEALRACVRAGLPVSGSATPDEQVRALRAAGLPEGAATALFRLAAIHARTTYARHPVTESEAREAWEAADLVRRTLADEYPANRRWRDALRAEPEELVDVTVP